MFWREKEKEKNDQNGAPPFGQIRVLVVGDSAVGKTSLVHLIMKNSAISRPSPTVGCVVSVKHVTCGNRASSLNNIIGDSERDFFVELWDISGHERYKDCRSLFYKEINGVIFVHDLSQRKTKTNLQKWASEIATIGTFSTQGSGGFGGLPVPFLVIGNKADIAAKESTGGSSGNLVDVARQWVEKQGLLPPSEEQLPLTENFPGSTSHTSVAKEGRFDKESIIKFFRLLIRKRYYPDEVPAQNSWSASLPQKATFSSSEILSEDDLFRKSTSLSSEAYKYNALPPLPAQRNLAPPPTLYPQQPMLVTENYNYQRFPVTGMLDFSSAKVKRSDINV